MPEALAYQCPGKQATCYFTSRFLMQLLVVLYETFNFREARRRLLDVLLANSLAALRPGCSVALRLSVLVSVFPNPAQLASIALAAFPGPIAAKVRRQQELQYLYNGHGIRMDGQWKNAKTIVRYAGGGPSRKRPYTALLAFCGTDGSLLRLLFVRVFRF